MSMAAAGTTSEAFFEAKYNENSDPWAFASSAYEQSRYSAILSFLNARRFQAAFEPGCSIGVLTERLAPFCDRLEAMDISERAASAARERCRTFPQVKVRQGALPTDIPDGTFDLALFSEIGYYFDPATLRALASDLAERLVPDGVFLAAHWLGNSPDHLLSGDEVHEIVRVTPGLELDASYRHNSFRVDRWRKC